VSRRTARKHAFELVFELPFHDKGDLDFLIESHLSDKDIPKGEREFIKSEFEGVAANLEVIDGLIAKFSEGWDIARLSKMDLAVMRLSAYEIMFSEQNLFYQIPVRASINEAVELAKEFGTDDSPAFVNGILGRIAAAEGKSPPDEGRGVSADGAAEGEKAPPKRRYTNYVKRG